MRRALDTQDDYAKVLYYGPTGRGKTTAVAHLANLGTSIMINSEGGVQKKPLVDLGLDVSNLLMFPGIKEDGTPERICYDDLYDLYEEVKAQLLDEPGCIAGIGWDAIPETQKLVLEDIVAKGIAKAERKGLERERFDVYLEDFGVNTEQMRILIRRFRDLPCHLALSAAPRRFNDPNGKIVYGPDLTPKFTTDVVGYMNVIVYVDYMELPGWGEDNLLYYGRVRNEPLYETKDRFNVLPALMPNPTMDRIVAYITGVMDQDTDPQLSEVRELRQAMKRQADDSEPTEGNGDGNGTKPKPPANRRTRR